MVGIVLTTLMGAALVAAAGTLLTGTFPASLQVYVARPFTHHSPAALVPVDTQAVLVSALSLLVLLAYAVAATLSLNRLFRRTSAGEAFFLGSFVLSLSLEAARLLAVALAIRVLDARLAVVVTRVVYMARLFGLASLFLATLLSLGMRYGDYAVLSGTSLLLALVMGMVVPVDTSRLTTGLVHSVSDGGGLLSAGASGAAIVALSSLLAPLVRKDRRLAGYGVGVTCLVLGRELFSLGPLLAFGLGLVLLVVGTLLVSRSLERLYLGPV